MSRALPLLAALALAACEAPFDPIAPSDAVFSMSGYLDASADTQWVRVEPFGQVLAAPAGPIEAEVALVLPDGRRAPMGQEVRTFATGPAHLFWTTADVAPGATYAVVAERPDGARSRATVRVPDDRDVTITLDDGLTQCPISVRVEGAEYLADVQAQYTLTAPRRRGERFRFSKLPSLVEEADGAFETRVFYSEDAVDMEIDPLPYAYPVTTEIVVSIGTSDWPAVRDLTLEDAIAASGLGAIEGGVGFVGGAVTTTVPFRPGYGTFPPPETGLPPGPCFNDASIF